MFNAAKMEEKEHNPSALLRTLDHVHCTRGPLSKYETGDKEYTIPLSSSRRLVLIYRVESLGAAFPTGADVLDHIASHIGQWECLAPGHQCSEETKHHCLSNQDTEARFILLTKVLKPSVPSTATSIDPTCKALTGKAPTDPSLPASEAEPITSTAKAPAGPSSPASKG